MQYDFDKIIERRGSNSYKWDSVEDEILPMWVADMDFQTAPCITEALINRARHGIFGYAKVPRQYYDAVTNWFSLRHNFIVEKDWLLFTTGVVPALSAIIKALAEPGDKVIVQAPVYNCFFSSIRNDGCTMVSNDLVYTNGSYTIDFDDLELKAADPKTKLLLLCNPHNPAGRVWTLEELHRLGTICLNNNVTVVADEIHCDLVYQGYPHIPFGSISREFLLNSVTCTSPSKAFNLAGLQCANIMAADEVLRKKIDKALNVNEVCEISPFAVEAVIAAYTKGGPWLDALVSYLQANYNYLKDYFTTHMPDISILPLEGTYLVWIDCTRLGLPSSEIATRLLKQQKLYINEGTLYGSNGEGFIRLNIACPRTTLQYGLSLLKDFFDTTTHKTINYVTL